MEAAELRRRQPEQPPKSADQIRREHERASLNLTRIRVARELAAATHPRYRESLQAALQHVDDQIARLSDQK